MRLRCRGLGEKLCQANLPAGRIETRRQSAAHFQITERKYSLAQVLLFLSAMLWAMGNVRIRSNGNRTL
jgi:hypothetical protein